MPVVIVTPLIEERDGLTKAIEDLGLTGEERGIGRLDPISYRDGNILIVQGGSARWNSPSTPSMCWISYPMWKESSVQVLPALFQIRWR